MMMNNKEAINKSEYNNIPFLLYWGRKKKVSAYETASSIVVDSLGVAASVGIRSYIGLNNHERVRRGTQDWPAFHLDDIIEPYGGRRRRSEITDATTSWRCW